VTSSRGLCGFKLRVPQFGVCHSPRVHKSSLPLQLPSSQFIYPLNKRHMGALPFDNYALSSEAPFFALLHVY